MAWFKVDDRLWSHPKWLAASPAARGLWVTAGSWCAAHEQDGHITQNAIRLLGHTRADANRLVKAGLWEESEDGWTFHNWDEFQPTSAELQAKREARAEAGRKGGLASGASRREANASANPEANASSFGEAKTNPVPSRPVPDPARPEEDTTYLPEKPEKRLPKSWAPTAEHVERAKNTGLDLMLQIEKFKAHAEENDRKAKNWNGAFTRWLINAAEYAENDRKRGRPPQQHSTTDERVMGWLQISEDLRRQEQPRLGIEQ